MIPGAGYALASPSEREPPGVRRAKQQLLRASGPSARRALEILLASRLLDGGATAHRLQDTVQVRYAAASVSAERIPSNLGQRRPSMDEGSTKRNRFSISDCVSKARVHDFGITCSRSEVIKSLHHNAFMRRNEATSRPWRTG